MVPTPTADEDAEPGPAPGMTLVEAALLLRDAASGRLAEVEGWAGGGGTIAATVELPGGRRDVPDGGLLRREGGEDEEDACACC